MPIKLPNGVGESEKSKIVSFQASNLKSNVMTADGQVWFWGGYHYDETVPKKQMK